MLSAFATGLMLAACSGDLLSHPPTANDDSTGTGGADTAATGASTEGGMDTATDGASTGGANGTAGSGSGSTGVTMKDGGSGDARATAGDGGAPLDRGPTPPMNGTQFPFPQNRESKFCTYPTAYKNADVRAAYQKWKTDTVTADGANGFHRVMRPNDSGLDPDSTVSEGIGYGMILAVYMNDQPLFDDLWKYEQHWLDENGLMNWYIKADGSGLGDGGHGAATDADEDMAWALVMADRQWGGQGSLDQPYLEIAKNQIQAIWQHEIFESKLARPGDTWGDWNTVNISYFAPAYYRVFESVTGDASWEAIIKTTYDTIDNALNDTNGNQDNGLVPAWCTSDGAPNANALIQGNATNYQYDSCRTPFRIGLDYCFFGEPRAAAYLAKTSAFFSAQGALSIVDGYALNGMPAPEHTSGQSAAFVGPAAVGAMSSAAYQSFVDQAYADVSTLGLLVGGVYYDDSWSALSLLMMTGNFLDYTAY